MRKFAILFFILFTIMTTSQAQSNDDYVVTIQTKFGDMIAILYDETPRHKANFIKLANEHFYDSLLFHRVIQGFMIQGGDPQSKNATRAQRLGNGGPGYTVEAEINPKFYHEKGALSAARLGDQANPTRASSGSQFYIVQGKKYTETELKTDPQRFGMALKQFMQNPDNAKYKDSITVFYKNNDRVGYENYLASLKPIVEQQLGIKVDKDIPTEQLMRYTTVGGAPHLDGQYTVFGKVIKGLEVIDKIAAQPMGAADRPAEDISMIVRVEKMSKKKIEQLYGHKYAVQPK